MANTLELLDKLNTELKNIDNNFNDFLNDSTITAGKYNTFLKSISALDTSSLDINKTVEIMTDDNAKQKDYPDAIPFIDSVNDPVKDEVERTTTVVNTNGEV